MTKAGKSSAGPSVDAPEATLIGVILDRSGSMNSIRVATIQGFNAFLEEQRKQKDGGRALMSLTQFDDQYEVNFVGEPIENVPDLDAASYVPRGSTALYDAIGRTVHEVEVWAREHEWTERVLLLIVTDGQENSSQEFSFAAIRELIAKKEKDGWNVAYMGANQDSYAVGGAMNIRAGYAGNWDATAGGAADAYERIGRAASRYRSSNLRGQEAKPFYDLPDAATAPAPTEGKLVPKEGAQGSKR